MPHQHFNHKDSTMTATLSDLRFRGIPFACLVDENGMAAMAATLEDLRKRGIPFLSLVDETGNAYAVPRTNAAAGPPGPGNDTTEGYAIGSRWIDTDAGLTWVAVAVAIGAALWVPLQPFDHPGYPTGRLFATCEGPTAQTTVAAADTLYLYPFYVRARVAITSLSMRIATGGTGSAVKMAVWANKWSGAGAGRPVGLPVAANNAGVSTTSPGQPLQTVSATLNPGVYWWGQVHTGTLPAVVALASGSGGLECLVGRATSGGTNTTLTALSIAQPYGSDITTLSFNGSESWTDVIGSQGVGLIRFGT